MKFGIISLIATVLISTGAFAQSNPVNIYIDVYVIDQPAGRNQRIYTFDFIGKILKQAELLTNNEFNFYLSKHEFIVDKNLYDQKLQQTVLHQLSKTKAAYGRFVLGITNPDTIDSAGMTFQSSFIDSRMPVIVMRSRINNGSKEDIIELARIFLHEFGHTFGFTHEGSLNSPPYNAENWWHVSEIREFIAQRISSFNKEIRLTCLQTSLACESSHLIISDGQLFEYKNGSSPWSKFRAITNPEKFDNNIFYGIDDSRGILFKIQKGSLRDEYFGFWSWIKKDKSPAAWNRIQGTFILN